MESNSELQAKLDILKEINRSLVERITILEEQKDAYAKAFWALQSLHEKDEEQCNTPETLT